MIGIIKRNCTSSTKVTGRKSDRGRDGEIGQRGAFDAFSLERGADRRPAGGPIVVFGVSNVAHDRFPARKAPIARICPTLVAQYWLETMLRGRGVR